MLQKLVSCLMALVLAAVFAGETAFAGGACRQAETPVVAVAEAHHAQPCHEETEAAARPDPQHTKSPCECVALLKASMAEEPELASSHVEPWRWEQPETVTFASLDLVPDGPPPKG